MPDKFSAEKLRSPLQTLFLDRYVPGLCLCLMGIFYTSSFDTPGSLQSTIQTTFDIQPYQFEYLYSIYSFPNIIECFFSGLLIDKVFGLNTGSIIFATIVLLGQTIVVTGGYTQIFFIMIIGRFVYGLGAETVVLCQNCFCVIWFKGKELNLMFGLLLAFGRLGTSFIFLISTPIYKYFNKILNKKYVLGTTMIPSLIATFLIVITTWILINITKKSGKTKHQNSEDIVINFKDVLKFPAIYWIMTIMLGFGNASTLAFVSSSQQLLKTKYNISTEEANTLCSVLNISSAVISPVIGLLVDKIGYNLNFCLLVLLSGSIGQLLMGLTECTPYVPLVMYGLMIAVLNCCGQTLVSRVVEHYQLATAYGIVQSFTNTSLTVFSLVAGYLLGSYGPLEFCMFFMFHTTIGVICCLIMLYMDQKSNQILNVPGAKIHLKEQNDELQ